MSENEYSVLISTEEANGYIEFPALTIEEGGYESSIYLQIEKDMIKKINSRSKDDKKNIINDIATELMNKFGDGYSSREHEEVFSDLIFELTNIINS